MHFLAKPWQKCLLVVSLVVMSSVSLLTATTLIAQTQPTTACDADLNEDGFVNLIDYSILVQHFDLTGPGDTPADINHDNQVNLLDYSALVAHFFHSCTPNSSPSPAPSPTATPSLTPTPTPSSTPQPTASPIGSAPSVGGCSIFPNDNPWNQDISQLPVHSLSSNYVNSIGASADLHPDLGGAAYGETYGIPFITVNAQEPKLPITFAAFGY
jgi:hypothetical protein